MTTDAVLMSRKEKRVFEERGTKVIKDRKGERRWGKKGIGKAGGRNIVEKKGNRRERKQIEQQDAKSVKETVEGSDDLMWIDGVKSMNNEDKNARKII